MSDPGPAPVPDDDLLEWDPVRFGTFADYATPDNTVATMSGGAYIVHLAALADASGES